MTGIAFPFTVTAQDVFNNPASTYHGTVQITSSDRAANLPVKAIMTAGVGVFTAVLATAGSQTLIATDSTNSITGMSSGISVLGLAVTSLTATSSGFVAVFNKPFNPTFLNLYDASTANFGPSDIILVGTSPSGVDVRGSLLIDPTDTTATFVKTGDFNGSGFDPATGVLAAGTYVLTFAKPAMASSTVSATCSLGASAFQVKTLSPPLSSARLR